MNCVVLDEYLISEEKIGNILSQINIRKASRPDTHLPVWILKEYRDFLSASLTNIFNPTIMTGKISAQLKSSNIVTSKM